MKKKHMKYTILKIENYEKKKLVVKSLNNVIA